MNQPEIFAPVFAMLALTMVVWVYMYIKRIGFIRSQNLSSDELTAEKLAQLSPPSVSNPSDNLKNLFEIPTLFYALMLYLFVSQQVDSVHLIAAWVFVVFRVLHSAVHCTINIVIVRFYLYLIATLSLWFMVVRAAMQFFG
jgi:hypothetical protein